MQDQPLEEQNPSPRPTYHFQTISETFERIRQGTDPWVAMGDFLDDWRRTPQEKRLALVEQPIIAPTDNAEQQKWAALCAATVEWLCWNDGLPFPTWTTTEAFTLRDPWFLYPGWRLRAWQLATTPAPFKMRNIFGGDRMLDRV